MRGMVEGLSDNLDIVCVGVGPAESDAPLVVDSDGKLTMSGSYELLKTVSRRKSHVEKTSRGIEHKELSAGDTLQIDGKAANSLV